MNVFCGKLCLIYRKKTELFYVLWYNIHLVKASVAQLDRVSVSETEGHRFDPCRVHHLQYTFLQQLKSNRGTISNVHAALRWYFALVDLKNNQLTDVYRF